MSKNIGKITQIISAVVDVAFENHLPNILSALECDNGGHKIILEVVQHLGDKNVRCIAMQSTTGLKRGLEAVDTGKKITVPVGKATLGRIMNVIGESIDNKGQLPLRNIVKFTKILQLLPNNLLKERYLLLVLRLSTYWLLM